MAKKKRYHLDASTFNRIREMDFQQMNDWIERLYMAAFTQGFNSSKGASVGDVMEAIGSINGIGPKRIKEIKKKLDDLEDK